MNEAGGSVTPTRHLTPADVRRLVLESTNVALIGDESSDERTLGGVVCFGGGRGQMLLGYWVGSRGC